MATEALQQKRFRVAEITNQMRGFEQELIDMYVDLRNENDPVNANTMDDMATSVTRAITFGKRFLIG